MVFKHKTKSGRVINFKNKQSFNRWQKGMFQGMNQPSSGRRRMKQSKRNPNNSLNPNSAEGKKEMRKRLVTADRVNAGREPKHLDIDRDLENKQTSTVLDDEVYQSWLDDQGSADLVGVDTIDYAEERKAIDQQLKPKQKTEPEVRTVQVSREEKETTKKKKELKEKQKAKQERLDIEFQRSGITKQDIQESQMTKAEIKRLIKRAVDNGAEASEVKNHIDLDTTFDNNIKQKPIFASSLEDFRKPEGMTKGEREWAEDYYLNHAEANPEKAIVDSQKEDKPVRDVITKPWIKSPTSKKGGDIEGIDDGSNPLTKDDF